MPELKIRVPDLSISLWVKGESGATMERRHLISEIFVDEIHRFKDIKNKSLFITLFRFAESSLGEFLGESYLKKYGLTLNNGVLKLKSNVISGSTARSMEKIMAVLTYGKYLIYISPAVLLLLIVYFIFSRLD